MRELLYVLEPGLDRGPQSLHVKWWEVISIGIHFVIIFLEIIIKAMVGIETNIPWHIIKRNNVGVFIYQTQECKMGHL